MARRKNTSPTVQALRADTKRRVDGGEVTAEALADAAEHRTLKKDISAEDRLDGRRLDTRGNTE
ncbi:MULTISPECIES: hypothetical protein [unclassified Streptomyces]|uniref:hypothetical protein n=1 Tax=Streptomyces sp. NPDC055082 TaxID=3365718 RepID=UPI0037CE65BF